jgi:hypothetical protein
MQEYSAQDIRARIVIGTFPTNPLFFTCGETETQSHGEMDEFSTLLSAHHGPYIESLSKLHFDFPSPQFSKICSFLADFCPPVLNAEFLAWVSHLPCSLPGLQGTQSPGELTHLQKRLNSPHRRGASPERQILPSKSGLSSKTSDWHVTTQKSFHTGLNASGP